MSYASIIMYFLAENGETFKTYLKYQPYFYILADPSMTNELMATLQKLY